jgi:phosphatidylethanolamine/phosphatidyl-N-methylethanolamine N-methyltransferase
LVKEMVTRGSWWERRRYAFWAPIYDLVVSPFRHARQRSIDGLGLRIGERVLLVGAGTGEDLPFIPTGTLALATDLTPEMLRRAARKGRPGVYLAVMDGHGLALPNGSFDAVVLHLILAVIPDPALCLAEAVRVLRPGGRIAVLDKFVAEGKTVSIARRLLNRVTSPIATDITRRLDAIIRNSGVVVRATGAEAAIGGRFTIAHFVTGGHGAVVPPSHL